MANNTRFGLSCGLVSPSGKIDQLLLEVLAAFVNWNKPLTGAASTAIRRHWCIRSPSPQRLVCRRLLRMAYGEPGVGLLTLPTLTPGLDFSDEVVR